MIIVKLCCLPKSMVDSVDNLMIGTIVFLVPVFWISQFWFRTKGPKLQSKHSRETKCNWPLIAHCAVGLEIVVFPFCPILLWVCAIRIVRKLCFLIDAWDVKGLCLCVFMDSSAWVEPEILQRHRVFSPWAWWQSIIKELLDRGGFVLLYQFELLFFHWNINLLCNNGLCLLGAF